VRKIFYVGIGLMLIILAVMVHGADDNTYLVVKDSNDRLTSLQNQVQNLTNQQQQIQNEVSITGYQVNSFRENFSGFLLVAFVFGALLSAYVNYRMVAKKFVSVVSDIKAYQINQQSVQQQESVQLFEQKQQAPKIEYDIITENVCPKDGGVFPDDFKFCPQHNKKLVMKQTKIPKQPALERIEPVAQNLENRARKPRWKFW
jgi:hypothetical protein